MGKKCFSSFNGYEVKDAKARKLTDAFVTPQMFGAVGNGVADDSDPLIACFSASHSVYIPSGTYLVKGYDDKIIDLQSNTTVLMANDATIKVIPNDKAEYYAFRINNKENILISGGNIVGEKDEHIGTTGEWGIGIGIFQSSAIIIENCCISNFWGDGIDVGSHKTDRTLKSNNVKIHNNTIHSNRRQGISVTGCDNISIVGNTIYNIRGTNPESGIDCEPNVNDTDGTVTHSNTGVYISGNHIYDTGGFSVQLYNGNKAIVDGNVIESFQNRKNYHPVGFSNNEVNSATIGTDSVVSVSNCNFSGRITFIGSFVSGTIRFNNCTLVGDSYKSPDAGSSFRNTNVEYINCRFASRGTDVESGINDSRLFMSAYNKLVLRGCSLNSAHPRGFGVFEGVNLVEITDCYFDFTAPQYVVSAPMIDIKSTNKSAMMSRNVFNYNNCTYSASSGSVRTNCVTLFDRNTIINANGITYLFRYPSVKVCAFNNVLPVDETRFCDTSTANIVFANNVYNQNVQI